MEKHPSPGDVQIRRAQPEDFNEVFRLFKQLHEHKALDREKVRGFYETLLASDVHPAWIAELNSRIVGYIDVVFRTYHYAFEFVARIETVIVDQSARRLGIGSALMRVCEQEAEANGCNVIEFDSAASRTSAHRFYEISGYTKRGFLFWKQL